MAEFYPAKTIFSTRSTYELMRWALQDEYRLDSASGALITVLGDMPAICHENTSTPAIIEFMKFAGLSPSKNIIRYQTENEAVSLTLDAAQDGYKIAYAYPPPSPLDESDALLFPVSLYNWLNDKSNLGELVDSTCLPESVVLPVYRLHEIMDFARDEPVFVKACHAGASGGGRDVYYCAGPDSCSAAVEWIEQNTSDVSAIRIEKEEKTGTCWCVNLAALESGVIYLGSASQLFDKPAHQTGNRIDPSDLPPDCVIDVALKTLERAAEMGYRGVAGFDIACRESGEPVVFDLNFRIAASTKMILLHGAISERVGGTITESWSVNLNGRLEPALERLKVFAESGRLVPTRFYDASALSKNIRLINGIIVGESIDRIASIRDEIASSLDGLLAD